MLNSPMLSIFQHFHAIPLRSPLISLRSKWRLTGFSRRFTPKNPVRLHNPFGELPRWGAKNVLPLNLIALPQWGRLRNEDAAIPDTQPSPRGEGAPKGRIGHWRYEREREGASQAGDLRKHPSAAPRSPFPDGEGKLAAASPLFWLTVFPYRQPSPRGEGAPKGRIGHRRYEREWENASQVDDLRKHPIHR